MSKFDIYRIVTMSRFEGDKRQQFCSCSYIYNRAVAVLFSQITRRIFAVAVVFALTVILSWTLHREAKAAQTG